MVKFLWSGRTDSGRVKDVGAKYKRRTLQAACGALWFCLITISALGEAPEGMALIPGGAFLMGSEKGLGHETPIHEVKVDSFYLDIHEVTNAEFATFVEATSYLTDAERWKWSIVFDPDSDSRERVAGAPWWVKADGADWRHPQGPDSSIEGKGKLPVVQVSWNDAAAYCHWAKKRLPTESEWEYAARAGVRQQEFSWGVSFAPEGRAMANTWTGPFPSQNTAADGYATLAPVGTFPPNANGLYDMAGNVWEWCADWYSPFYYRLSPHENPRGPVKGSEKVLRGGSWLCSDQWCTGYRVAHRNKSAADSGLPNTGFRCAMSLRSGKS